MVDNPTKWNKIISNLKFNNIPFTLINKIKVTTKNNKEYEGNTYDDFLLILELIKNQPAPDVIFSLKIDPKNRKIKKLVQECLLEVREKLTKN